MKKAAKERANKARSEAAKGQHAVSNPRAGERVSGAGPRGPAPERDAKDFDPCEDAQDTCAGGRLGTPPPDAHPARTPKADPVRAMDRLAASAGVSLTTMKRASELAAKSPKHFARVEAGEVSLSKALGEVKLADKRSASHDGLARATP